MCFTSAEPQLDLTYFPSEWLHSPLFLVFFVTITCYFGVGEFKDT